MSVGILMLAGKILFLVLLYIFIFWAFRGLLAQMALEREAAGAARGPSRPGGKKTAAAGAPPPSPAAATVGPEPHQRTASETASLVVLDPGSSPLGAGQRFPLTAAVTIGRTDRNGIIIQDRFTSGEHAMIFLQHGRRILRDRDSTNGTYHNGQRISSETVLQNGDRITIGSVVFEYRSDSRQQH